MDVVQLDRLQFALTISFHFVFPAVTIGLAGLIAIIETFRWWTKRDVYDRLSVFLAKLFAVTFVIGVVSGIVMEFQFGTNWSRFSGFVGDIFGVPLAAEGISAFFLESAFVGIVLFGRDRVGSTVRWIAGLLVFAGTTLSAFWILVANSWMQSPAGFKIVTDSNGVEKAQMTDFFQAMFNPSTVARFLHTVTACWVVGAFFLMGICAWYILRGRGSDVTSFALRLSMVVAFLGAAGMFATGDLQTREVQANQPVKFAAMEGVCQTANGVPLDIIAVPPSQDCSSGTGLGISIPYGLSAMSDLDPNGQIEGLDQVAPSLWPPVAATFLSFHLMVGLGMVMMLLMVVGIFFLWRRTLEEHRWWLWLAVVAIPAPIMATELGWMTAEVGRQPWIVQGLLMVSQGTSPGVSAADVSISIVAIVLLYALLFFLWLYGLTREIRRGPETGAEAVQPTSGETAPPAVPTVSAASGGAAPAKGGR
ncbi:MAG: cytochrome ubiquinol oxidase subunit I [Candidatus Limnocylindrales bacterium]